MIIEWGHIPFLLSCTNCRYESCNLIESYRYTSHQVITLRRKHFDYRNKVTWNMGTILLRLILLLYYKSVHGVHITYLPEFIRIGAAAYLTHCEGSSLWDYRTRCISEPPHDKTYVGYHQNNHGEICHKLLSNKIDRNSHRLNLWK